ncbi:unnamed protein product [Sphagnum jensenii]|uniref:NPF family transporter n=1 Tax=Sphagnum jensenii TaxID=128206 RepID=A0ABP1BCB1_9BRYO
MDNLTSGQVQYEERTHNDDDEQRLPVDHEPAASTIDVIDKFNIGFTPVDLRGRPLLDLSNTGGWRAASFIFGNETANNMVATGIFVSMLFYLYYEMHISLPKANVIMNDWLGTTGLIPLFSGFIADAYLGRYYTICLFSAIYVLGLLLLPIISIVAGLKPSSSGCGVVALYLGTCTQASTTQTFFLYLSIYTIALGLGGIRPCLSTFGADQFDMENPKEKLQLARFFNWYYLAFVSGSIFSATLVVYLYTSVSWAWAFGCMAIAMAAASLLFLLGTPLYRHHLPSGSPLTRLLQVLVASTRKWRVQVPDDESLLYEVHDKESAIVGSRKVLHVHDLRFFDKAAVQIEEEEKSTSVQAPNPWKLCTVTQVEELKAIVRLIPTWACTIIVTTLAFQFLVVSAAQTLTMDRHIGSFVVPPQSFGVGFGLLMILVLFTYDVVMVPLMRRYTHNPRGISILQRIGVGIFLSILSAVASGIIERQRRKVSWETNTAENPNATVPIPVWWLLIPLTLAGVADITVTIAQLDLFYQEVPDSIRSLGAGFVSAAGGIGAFLGSLLLSVTNRITSRNGKNPWVDHIISVGHADYYIWLLGILAAIDFLAFLYFAHIYKYKIQTESHMRGSLEPPVSRKELYLPK